MTKRSSKTSPPLAAAACGIAGATKKHRERQRPARLIDVARAAGVSTGVVSRVLNGGTGNSRASKETEKRILAAAQRLSYKPNLAARRLQGKRSNTFGLLVASAGDPLRSFLVQYLDIEAVKIGCRTMICNTVGNPAVGPDQFEAHVAEIARHGVDGVLCAVHAWCDGDRAALLERHPNTVFYEDPGIPGAARVAPDRFEASRLQVRHLFERGRRRIALAVPGLTGANQTDRLDGYRAGLEDVGLPFEESLVFDGAIGETVYLRYNTRKKRWDFPFDLMDVVVDRLVVEGKADAIAAHDDFWASTLLRFLRRRGVRVPEDVAVMGYLNHYLCDWTDPPLTTLDLCHEQAAATMVGLLERLVTGETLSEGERAVRLCPRVIQREST